MSAWSITARKLKFRGVSSPPDREPVIDHAPEPEDCDPQAPEQEPQPMLERELRSAVNLLANLTEAYTVALFLREPSGEELRPVVWHTLSKSFRTQAVSPGAGLVGYVDQQGTVVDVDRYAQEATSIGLYDADEGIKAFLALPVGECGVLVVDSKNRQVFGEREKKIVRDFSEFLASLVATSQMAHREHHYGRIIDLLYDVENASQSYRDPRSFYASIIAAGSRFTGLAMGFVCLLLPGRGEFVVEAVDGPLLATLRGRSFPLGQGLVGWILKEGRTLHHGRLRPQKGRSYLLSPDEPLRGYNTFIGAPVSCWRRLVGMWGFAGQDGLDLNEESEQALHLAGHRLAATILHQGLLEVHQG